MKHILITRYKIGTFMYKSHTNKKSSELHSQNIALWNSYLYIQNDCCFLD